MEIGFSLKILQLNTKQRRPLTGKPKTFRHRRNGVISCCEHGFQALRHRLDCLKFGFKILAAGRLSISKIIAECGLLKNWTYLNAKAILAILMVKLVDE